MAELRPRNDDLADLATAVGACGFGRASTVLLSLRYLHQSLHLLPFCGLILV